jgi:ketosteroid isomerase-like protein
MQAISFINSFYQAIIHKKVNDIVLSYLPSEEVYVILEGPRLATKGIEKIADGWRAFCSSNITLSSIAWIEGPFVYDTTECTSLIGIIRLQGDIGDKSFDNTFRASFVLAKTNDGFKIVHEHVSGALEDPYGIGDWKKN